MNEQVTHTKLAAMARLLEFLRNSRVFPGDSLLQAAMDDCFQLARTVAMGPLAEASPHELLHVALDLWDEKGEYPPELENALIRGLQAHPEVLTKVKLAVWVQVDESSWELRSVGGQTPRGGSYLARIAQNLRGDLWVYYYDRDTGGSVRTLLTAKEACAQAARDDGWILLPEAP